MATIDTYLPEQDEFGLLECWNAALGQSWPLNAALLRVMTHAAGPHDAGAHFVAREGGRIAGILITQVQRRNERADTVNGHIAALVVAPWAQRRGIGSALLRAGLDYLRKAGAARAQLGGRVPRFWPGVPKNLPGAVDFFRAQGWQFDHEDWDLARSLADYETPAAITARIAQEKLRIDAATGEEVPEILDFERREFALWYEEFAYPARVGDVADILVARDPAKGVVGTLILWSARRSHPTRADILWKTLLGEDMGSLNAVGVAASERGRGIGIALVARGSEVLKARGVGNAAIGWTTLVDFYGKLGYQPWRAYAMSAREFA